MTTCRLKYWTDPPEVNLMPTSVEEIFKDIKIGGSLSCRDYAFMNSREIGLTKSEVRTLNFRRLIFRLFKEFLKTSEKRHSLWISVGTGAF